MNRFFLGLSRLLAILGGIVLAVLIVIVVVSIVGRETGLGAITGDYELVEAGMAFCIFAFLPYAHMTGAHATVDIFTNALGERAHRWLLAVIDTVFAVVLIIIAVQLYGGLVSKMNSGQTTLLLQFPVWWGYLASFCAAVIGGVVGVWHALVRITEAVTGNSIAVEGGET
ncbi:TRAP transporter small permease subunit [Maritimibacter sp. DP07]|jgi:TRAP-type C4-dicarboxylate transport system permease small subunit|uniref:TRAP transporter small permease protein n=1 Tax=Maritimibacter harenae TaxID=2606218 RepID=A0A845M7I3_9RHOB|nr:TRAP transporter small permease [Maritimibacter harenae]MZR12504.1 TRAP transporter small permease subunit [Maritimibacter harenae]